MTIIMKMATAKISTCAYPLTKKGIAHVSVPKIPQIMITGYFIINPVNVVAIPDNKSINETIGRLCTKKAEKEI